MKEIAYLFIKLGSVGFGGPVALIGMMEEECVRIRKWLTIEDFQRVVSVSKLFPGPLASLIAIRIGKMKHGNAGGIIAGIGLVLPAFVLILLLTEALSHLASSSYFQQFLTGLTLSALAISFVSTVNLSKPLFLSKAMPATQTALLIAVVGTLTFFYPKQEPLFIIASGCASILFNSLLFEAASLMLLLSLFWNSFKASIFTFGSGIAIVPALRTTYLEEHHWISSADFLKGLALAQVTPGPLLIISSYLGLMTAKLPGALSATLGTFLPAFIFGLGLMPLAEKSILKSQRLKYFFNGLIPAVCGAIFGSLIKLSLYSVQVEQNLKWERLVVITLLSALMIRYRIHSLKILILGGAVVALLLPIIE